MPRSLSILLGPLLLACGGPEDHVHTVRGVVQEVVGEYDQVVVAHEDIPGLMPAMTMNFDVADPALLERLEPGHAIEFELSFTGKSYRILSARVLGEEEADTTRRTLAEGPAARDPAPPIRLVDHNGDAFALADLAGKAVLLDFIFTRCPGPCPILTGLNVAVQERLPPEVRARTHFVSVSLDPLRDTPATLRRYGEKRGADLETWSFLTGPVEEVEAVLASYGVGSTRRPDGEIEHIVVTFLIDLEGRIAQRYLGLEHDPDVVARALASLAARAAPEDARS